MDETKWNEMKTNTKRNEMKRTETETNTKRNEHEHDTKWNEAKRKRNENETKRNIQVPYRAVRVLCWDNLYPSTSRGSAGSIIPYLGALWHQELDARICNKARQGGFRHQSITKHAEMLGETKKHCPKHFNVATSLGHFYAPMLLGRWTPKTALVLFVANVMFKRCGISLQTVAPLAITRTAEEKGHRHKV